MKQWIVMDRHEDVVGKFDEKVDALKFAEEVAGDEPGHEVRVYRMMVVVKASINVFAREV